MISNQTITKLNLKEILISFLFNNTFFFIKLHSKHEWRKNDLAYITIGLPTCFIAWQSYDSRICLIINLNFFILF
jgi:hypothetical protein